MDLKTGEIIEPTLSNNDLRGNLTKYLIRCLPERTRIEKFKSVFEEVYQNQLATNTIWSQKRPTLPVVETASTLTP